jgi:methylenetetrahydrofolate dehydrogenase (NADP+)/methenyltetrahydrofolate cyclohydrolase
MAIIFDGYQLAAKKELRLKEKVEAFKAKGVAFKIAAILFVEDEGSLLYSTRKKEAAERVGIGYQLNQYSFADSLDKIQAKIEELNQDETVSGIIIQKPWTRTWLNFYQKQGVEKTAQDFQDWWLSLVSKIATKKSHGINKDIDGLHPETLAAIEQGTWIEKKMVLPATVRAVLTTIKFFKDNYEPEFCYCGENTLIVGKSDLLGKPLAWHISRVQTCGIVNPGDVQKAKENVERDNQVDPNQTETASVATETEKSKEVGVKLVGRSGFKKLLEQENSLKGFGLIVSATGQANLINGAMISEGTVLVDVGEPEADLDFESCKSKAKFITPVPGGVGPMTVVSLLANTLDLLKNR